MIIGTGIDIIEVKRIEAAIGRKSFIKKVFTLQEEEYCESRGSQRTASYAARFAGKEAVAKAFGTGVFPGTIRDIEIVNNPNGNPKVRLTGGFFELAERMKVLKIHISLTHTKEYAAAQAIIEGEGGKNT